MQASCGVSEFAGRRLLADRLDVLFAWASQRMLEPPEVLRFGEVRIVQVFEHIGYAFIDRLHRVAPVRRMDDGRWVVQRYTTDLARPLCRPGFLEEAVRRLGLSDNFPQRGLFGPGWHPVFPSEHDRWLCHAAYARLVGDPWFRALRRQALPRALALDPEVMRLARLARPLPHRDSVTNIDYSLAWRHRALFADVHAETPGLLPLVRMGLHERTLRPASNVVGQLKAGLRANGVTEAGWRYLARHGARLLRPAWRVAVGGASMNVAIHYLRALQAAGLPPPPPPSFVAAWLAGIGVRVNFHDGWCDVPAAVMGLALREAHARRRGANLANLVREFGNVAPWAADERVRLDKPQRRAGWEALVRRHFDWLFEEHERAVDNHAVWTSALGECDVDGFRVVPLTSDAALLEEAQAMRHCVRNFTPDCMDREVRIFSLRDAASGARVATLGIARKPEGWRLFDAKAAGNFEASARARLAGMAVAEAYERREGEGAPPVDATLAAAVPGSRGDAA